MKNIELIKEVTHKNVSRTRFDSEYKRHSKALENGTLKQGELDMSNKPVYPYSLEKKLDHTIRIRKMEMNRNKILHMMERCDYFNDFQSLNESYNEVEKNLELSIRDWERKYNEDFERSAIYKAK